MRFHHKEGVEVVAFIDWSYTIHIQPPILITFMLLKGLILTIKGENICNKSDDGGFCLKRQKLGRGF